MNTPQSAQLAIPAVLLAVGLSACSKHQSPVDHAPQLPAANVRVYQVGHTSHEAFEQAVGTVQAQLHSVIEANVGGRIEKLPVVTGQEVNAGDLLAQLDAREIQARLDRAVATRDQADADLQRFSKLLEQDAVTRAEYDAVQARQRIAQAAVDEAQTQLEHTRVVAPFDGVITRKHADVGDLAGPGRPLLQIEDPTRLRLEANVPEALIPRVRLGDQLRVRIDALNQDLEGKVAEIAPSADPNSRTFLVKVDLPAQPDLRAGQFGRLAVPAGRFATLRVPASAVTQRGQLEIAFVADNNRARLRLVKTGKRIGKAIEILSGVDSNETVIVEGLNGLLDGQPISIAE